MAEPARRLPPGSEKLSIDERIEYLHSLWDSIAADEDSVPAPEWHREVVAERFEAHRSRPDEVESWDRVRDRMLRRLRGTGE